MNHKGSAVRRVFQPTKEFEAFTFEFVLTQFEEPLFRCRPMAIVDGALSGRNMVDSPY